MTLSTAAILASTSAASLAAIVIAGLVVLLIGKELVSGRTTVGARRVSQALNVVVIPLVFVFLAALVFHIAGAVLR